MLIWSFSYGFSFYSLCLVVLVLISPEDFLTMLFMWWWRVWHNYKLVRSNFCLALLCRTPEELDSVSHVKHLLSDLHQSTVCGKWTHTHTYTHMTLASVFDLHSSVLSHVHLNLSLLFSQQQTHEHCRRPFVDFYLALHQHAHPSGCETMARLCTGQVSVHYSVMERTRLPQEFDPLCKATSSITSKTGSDNFPLLSNHWLNWTAKTEWEKCMSFRKHVYSLKSRYFTL